MTPVFILIGVLLEPSSGKPNSVILDSFSSYTECDLARSVFDYKLYEANSHANTAVLCLTAFVETF